MGKTYDHRPNVSTTPYLRTAGKTCRDNTVNHLSTAIDDMEEAAQLLGNVKGLGTELYIERLHKEINKLILLRTALKKLK